MSKFVNNTVDLGTVKEREYLDVYFQFKDDEMNNFSYCTNYCSGCINIKECENNKLHITLYTGTIPVHLNTNTYNLYKDLIVVFNDNTSEELTIKALLVK